MAIPVYEILNPPLLLSTYKCQETLYCIIFTILTGKHFLFPDLIATLSALRENVTRNEKNIDTTDRAVSMLSSPAGGGGTQTSDAMERLHQLEQANTSKTFFLEFAKLRHLKEFFIILV